MAKKIHVRPGKSQSKVAFGVGIAFCIIGVLVVIPMFGLFGVLWTAVAGWIAYTHWRNGFTDKGIDSKVIEIEDDGEDVTVTEHPGFGYRSYSVDSEESGSKSDGLDIEERLKALQNLYEQRLITREEYDEKKQEILKEL